MAEPRKNTNYMVMIYSSNESEGNRPILIQAPLPEEIGFDSSNSYEAPFAQGLIQDQTLRNLASVVGFRAATPAMTAQLWQGTTDQELSVDLVFHTETDPINDVRRPFLDLLYLTTPGVSSTTNMLKSPGPSLELSFEEAGRLVGDSVALGKAAVEGLVRGASSQRVPDTKQSMIDTATTSITGNGGQANNANQTPAGLGTTQFWKKRIKNRVSLQIGNYAFFDCVVINGVGINFHNNLDPSTGWPHHMSVSVRFTPMFTITREELEDVFPVKAQGAASTSGAAGLLGLFL
jgi:hypothetical protein